MFLRDLSNVMLLDKDILDSDVAGFSSAEVKKSGPANAESCDDSCFNQFYDKLTQRQDQKVRKTEDISFHRRSPNSLDGVQVRDHL